MSKISVDGRKLRAASLRPPVSKSDALRALTLADVTGLPPPELGSDPPEDVVALVRGLSSMRVGSDEPISCGDGAAPFRILLGQAAIRAGATCLTGSSRLAERPHVALVRALEGALGAEGLRITPGSPWPWCVEGTSGAGGRGFIVQGHESSQFGTSLLLAAARRAFLEGEPWTVQLERSEASAGYIELTLHWLRRAGLVISRIENVIRVSRGAPPSTLGPLPADWSSAGYLLAVAWKTGGEILGLDWESAQPDRAMIRVLREIGLTVEQNEARGTTVRGQPTAGAHASAHECPDLIPTLAVLACALPGPSVFSDLEVLRGKESDRLQGILELLGELGAQSRLRGVSLEVHPPSRTPDLFFASGHGDHRLVMAAATAALILGKQVEIEDSRPVRKSFPGFFEELSRSGAIVC